MRCTHRLIAGLLLATAPFVAQTQPLWRYTATTPITSSRRQGGGCSARSRWECWLSRSWQQTRAAFGRRPQFLK